MCHVIAETFQLHADHSYTNPGCFFDSHVKSVTLWRWQNMEVRLIIRTFVGVVVRVIVRVVRVVVGLVIRAVIRFIIRTFVRLVTRVVVVRIFVTFLVAINMWDGVITILFIHFQYELALFDIAIGCSLSRTVAGPCFIFTFCPPLIVKGIKVIFPPQVEFIVCYVIVIYFDVADFSEGWFVQIYKFCFICLTTFSKESNEKVLMLMQILDLWAFYGSHCFTIDFECHLTRGPLNIVLIEALMILNVWFPFWSTVHDAAAES